MSQLSPALPSQLASVPPCGSQPHITAVSLCLPWGLQAGSRSCSCSSLPAGTAGVLEGLGRDEPEPPRWRGTGSWAAKCSCDPVQQEHAGPENQPGRSGRTTHLSPEGGCGEGPLPGTLLDPPVSIPWCWEDLTPLGVAGVQPGPCPGLSPPHPVLGSIPLTALYPVSLVPKSVSHGGLRAQTQTFRSLFFSAIMQRIGHCDTNTGFGTTNKNGCGSAILKIALSCALHSSPSIAFQFQMST